MPETAQHKIKQALDASLPGRLIVAVVAVCILFFVPVLLWTLFQYVFHTSQWWLLGAIVGLVWGVVIGGFVFLRLSSGLQAGGAGFSTAYIVQFLIDWIKNPGSDGPESIDLVTAKLGLIEKLILDIFARAGADLAAVQPPVTTGVWVFVIVVALLMLLSAAEKKT